MSLTHIGGVPVFSNVMVPEFTVLPVKSLPLKNWHKRSRASYRARVNKKWVKRFGTKTERTIVSTGGAIFAHPNTFKLLEKTFDETFSR